MIGKLTLLRWQLEDTRQGEIIKASICWIKRWIHYWFGKRSYVSQFGNYTILKEPSKLSKVDFKLAEYFIKNRYSPTGQIEFLSKRAVINHHDPLESFYSCGWKANLVVHTRRSWKKYVHGSLKAIWNI